MSVSSRNNFGRIGLVALLAFVMSCDINDLVDPSYRDYFIKYYGGDGNQEGKDLVVNGDGTMIILGTSTTIVGSKRMYVAKVDSEGEILWQRNLGSSSNDEVAQDIEAIGAGADAGNFVVLSNVTRNLEDSLDIRVTVISPDGDSLKSVLINLYESQEAKSITPLSDGSYYVCGKVINSDTLNVELPLFDLEDVLIFKVSENLVASDFFRIGGSSVGSGIKIFESGAVFSYAGYSDELTGGEPGVASDFENNYFFRQFTTNPNLVPSAYVGLPTQHETLMSVAKSPSGNYLAVGTQTSLTGGSKKLYAGMINNSFVPISEVDIEDDAEGVGATATADGQFLVVGNKIGGAGNRNIWLAKVNVLLDVTAPPLSFGGPNNDDSASAVAELPNGDIVILGTMNLVNQNKIALIKLRSNGQF